MIRFITLLLFLILIWKSTFVFGCEIITYPKLFLLSNKPDTYRNIIRSTTCDDNESIAFMKIVGNIEGTITSIQISKLIREQINTASVSVIPNKITVLKNSSLLRSQIPDNFAIDNIRFLDTVNSIGLSQNDIVNLECLSCKTTGERHFKIVINNPISTDKKNIWGKVDILQNIKLFKATTNIKSFNSKLNSSLFESVIEKVSNSDDYFQEIETLKYYTTNKPIIRGEPLRKSDLTPIKVITPGASTKVVIRERNLVLETIGIAKSGAIIGQDVTLTNPQTRKVIMGKAIDFNKVLVEL